MKGINVAYSLDPKYFEVGCAYKMLVNREVKIGLLTKYEKECVAFKILEKGDVVDLILTLDQLMFHDSYSLVKMKPDYENGVFSNE